MTESFPTPSPLSHGPAHLSRSRAVLLCSGPIAIGILVCLDYLVTHSFNLQGYYHEMFAAAIISLVAGFLAVLPMLMMIRRGLIVMVRLTMLAAALRMIFMLAGLLLASGPGWHLSLVPLAIWTAGCYLALLIAESSAAAWVMRQG